LSQPQYFWGVLTVQEIWKESGWGTILFLAAISGIDPQLYEAAVIDGAGRMGQIRHITLPSIAPTIVVLLIIRLGQIASVPLEKVLLMQNPLVIEVAEVFDTYSFSQGVRRGLIGIGVAVGMFKGFIGMALVLFSNWVVKRLGHEGIY
jgi:putative aldouronate transport system permease protein